MKVGTRAENPFERVAMAAGQVPEPLFESYMALMGARVIMSGVSLGVFEALDERPDDAAGLARRLSLDPAGTDVLMVALHALGYVSAEGGRYTNTGRADRWLLPGRDQSITDWVGTFTYDMWEHFGHLEDVVRHGKPIGLHEREADDPYWERYMRGLFDLSKLSADVVARLIPAKDPRRLLDLAGGHGGFAMALCRRHPKLEATIVELEGSARIGRKIVAEQGMSDRVEFRAGDFFEIDLGTDHDIATAFSIVHHFDPERNVELLRRARSALRAGGTMAVLELERPPDGKAGSQIGTLTGVLFYITSAARTYRADEIEGFLKEAGFSGVRSKHHPRLPGNVVVTGRA